jgi:two-component system OmpR family sensor kinase
MLACQKRLPQSGTVPICRRKLISKQARSRSIAMKQPTSITFQLFLVFFLFFLLTIVLGLFSLWRLSDFNRVSSDIRDLWLPNTRFLGDLNNFTSDFRAAEGTNLLAVTADEFEANEKEINELDRSIVEAEHGYERLSHSAAEAQLYARFRDRWNHYKEIASGIVSRSAIDRRTDVVHVYLTISRAAYNTASDALTQLTDRNVANAREASERSDKAYHQARWLIGAAIIVAGLIMFIALGYVRRSLSAPLLVLAGCMRRLATNVTNIEISSTERRDEIGEMARSVVVFRNNAIELALVQHSLAQQASMLEEKLNHERRLAQLQRNFVSMASHEFRTPLTIIDGHAQRLAKMNGRAGTDEIAQRSAKIRSAVLRMTTLIDGLLHSTQIIDGELYFHPTAFDMRALVHDVCRLHREMTPGSQILENFGAQPLPMEGDPKLLSQVLSNLLSNAIKYSPGGGLIKVSARSEPPGHLVVIVEDHGIGIPAADLDRLFARYYRGSNVSGIVGTGVGLYLIKIVIDLHEGEIAVESQEGKGTRFTIRLPIRSSERAESERKRGFALSEEAAPADVRASPL